MKLENQSVFITGVDDFTEYVSCPPFHPLVSVYILSPTVFWDIEKNHWVHFSFLQISLIFIIFSPSTLQFNILKNCFVVRYVLLIIIGKIYSSKYL